MSITKPTNLSDSKYWWFHRFYCYRRWIEWNRNKFSSTIIENDIDTKDWILELTIIDNDNIDIDIDTNDGILVFTTIHSMLCELPEAEQ